MNKEGSSNYSQFRIDTTFKPVGNGEYIPDSAKLLKDIKPDEGHEMRIGKLGKSLLGPEDDPDTVIKNMTPEQKEAWERKMRGISEEIIHAETEPERLFYLYGQLEIIVDRNDDWTARMLKSQLDLHVMRGSDVLKDLNGETDFTKDKNQKGLERALTIVKDVDLLFDQWYQNYRYLSSSSAIFKTAFNPLPEFITPSVFARIYGEMPGFKEGESEWVSMSDQVDMSIRAYLYLALQSDQRLKDELEWFKGEGGFDKIFVNDSDELEWVRNLKLSTLPNEYDQVADLYGKKPDQLTDSDWERLDELPAFNRFADAANGGSMNKTRDAVISLISKGKHQDRPAMKMQARIAEGFAKQTFLLFGFGGMYGTRGVEFDENGRAIEVAAEGYPWADASADLMNPQDKTVYNEQSSYYAGSLAWEWFAPKHLQLDFVKMLSVIDKDHPQSKALAKSAWELYAQGKTFGEIFKDEDHITDWGLRSYLIRFLFNLKEDSGAQLAMSGELTRGKNQSNINSPKFWEDAEKAIHIVCRPWIITEGKNKKWFEDHASEIPSELKKMVEAEAEKAFKLDNKLSKSQIEQIKSDFRRKMDENEDFYKRKAENNLLKLHVGKEKNRWKAITWLSAMQNTIPPERKTAISVATNCGFLDENVLKMSENIDFSISKTGSGRKQLKQQMQSFINAAANSIN